MFAKEEQKRREVIDLIGASNGLTQQKRYHLDLSLFSQNLNEAGLANR